MPLSFANIGVENTVKNVYADPDLKRHLGNMGFVIGSHVTVLNSLAGNIIVNIKNSRVAISSEMAQKIMI